MSGFSTYLAQRLISATLGSAGGSGGSAFTPPTALYLALFTSDPTDDNVTTNEVAGAWYARKATGSWSVPVGAGANSSSNSNQILFSAVTDAAVTVSHWGIYDALTSGNLLYSDTVGTAKTFNIGDVPVVAASALSVQLL